MDPEEEFQCETAGDGAEELNAAAAEKAVDTEEQDREHEDGSEAKEADAAKPTKPEGEEGEDGEEGEEEGDKHPSTDEEGKRNPKFEKRVAKLTSRLKAAEEELTALKAGKKPEPEQRGGKPEEAETADKPKIEDYDTYEEYVDAVTDWKVDQKFKERETANAGKSEHDKFVNRVSEGKKRFADFDEVVTDDVKISTATAEAIKASDDPAAILHYLGSNEEEAERLLTLSPAKAALEIGKIEAKLTKGEKPKLEENPNKVTNAPDPITPPKGNGGKTTKSIDDMDADEYIRFMNKKQGVQREFS